MSLWEAALLGVVQGLTEFLPVSSTAHLLIVQQLLHPDRDVRDTPFTVIVQLGTLVAVLIYFWKDIYSLTRAVLTETLARRFAASAESRMAWLIVLGTIPVVIVGGLLKSWLKATFYNVPAMAWVAIAFAVLMAAAEVWAHRRRAPTIQESGIRWPHALWIGLWQSLALMPGASRSGTTITAGLFAGLARPAAARFSFLLSLPAVFAAGMKELYDETKKPDGLFNSGDDLLALAVGLIVSAVVGYLSIAVLLRFLKRYSMAVFIAYRLALGVGLLALLSQGYLTSK